MGVWITTIFSARVGDHGLGMVIMLFVLLTMVCAAGFGRFVAARPMVSGRGVGDSGSVIGEGAL